VKCEKEARRVILRETSGITFEGSAPMTSTSSATGLVRLVVLVFQKDQILRLGGQGCRAQNDESRNLVSWWLKQ